MNRTLREGLGFIIEAWRPQLALLPLLILLTLISSAVATAYPLVLKTVIDALETAFRLGEEPVIGSLLLILGLIAFGRVAAYVYPAVRAWVNIRIAAGVRVRVFRRVIEGDHSFRAKFSTGDILTRLTDDLEEYPKAAWFCCSGIFRAVESSSKILFAVGVMIFLEPRLTLIALMPLPVMIYIFYRIQGGLYRAYEKQQKSISSTNNMLEAAFTGIQTVKAYGTGPRKAAVLADILEDRAVHQLDVQRYFAIFQIADALASRAGQVLTIVVGGVFVMRGDLTLGTLYAFYVYLDMLVHPLQDLPNLLISGRGAMESMRRLDEIESEATGICPLPKQGENSLEEGEGEKERTEKERAEKEKAEKEGNENKEAGTEKSAFTGAVSDTESAAGTETTEVAESAPVMTNVEGLAFEEVTACTEKRAGTESEFSGIKKLNASGGREKRFRKFPRFESMVFQDVACSYSPGAPPVIDSFSFTLERGERLAVVGSVGSGKSTLICLLAGLLRPVKGGIHINGMPLSFPVPDFYRAGIGWVPQEALLFSDTIRWNISLGREAENENADLAMEVAQLLPDLSVLPEGERTVLGSKGARISGGQRQRVAIARALARRPELLLLDDCTASLDAESEELFWRSMDRAFSGMTTVVATHRLATVARADRVILIEKGRMTGVGSPAEMEAKYPEYSRVLIPE